MSSFTKQQIQYDRHSCAATPLHHHHHFRPFLASKYYAENLKAPKMQQLLRPSPLNTKQGAVSPRPSTISSLT